MFHAEHFLEPGSSLTTQLLLCPFHGAAAHPGSARCPCPWLWNTMSLKVPGSPNPCEICWFSDFIPFGELIKSLCVVWPLPWQGCALLGHVCHIPQQSPHALCRSVVAAQGIDPAWPELGVTGSSEPVLAQTRAQTKPRARWFAFQSYKG